MIAIEDHHVPLYEELAHYQDINENCQKYASEIEGLDCLDDEEINDFSDEVLRTLVMHIFDVFCDAIGYEVTDKKKIKLAVMAMANIKDYVREDIDKAFENGIHSIEEVFEAITDQLGQSRNTDLYFQSPFDACLRLAQNEWEEEEQQESSSDDGDDDENSMHLE